MDRQFGNRNESRVAKLIESLETCDRISYNRNLLTEKNRQNEYRQIWKKVDVRKNVLKRGEVKGGDFDLLRIGQIW